MSAAVLLHPAAKYQTAFNRWLANTFDALIFLPFIFLRHLLENSTNYFLFAGGMLGYLFCWTAYLVICHGRWGQTLGKKLTGIKLYDTDEQHLIGYRRAFYREVIPFLLQFAAITSVILQPKSAVAAKTIDSYQMGMLAFHLWFLLEIVTLLLNPKRRAVHDFIAGSVVLNISERNRERMQQAQQQVLAQMRRNQ